VRNRYTDSQESYKSLWSYNFVTDEGDLPELATNAEWRSLMTRARKTYGFTQQQLADKLGVSQAIISKIESGETGSSKLVMPICETLSIPEPVHLTDPDEREWMQLGRVLRARNPEQARAALKARRDDGEGPGRSADERRARTCRNSEAAQTVERNNSLHPTVRTRTGARECNVLNVTLVA
jgi:transcriptional regulator with XRE-family HTH domain